MGKLRIEPKVKQMDPDLYRNYLEILREAQKLAADSHLFYDLDEGEEQGVIKKGLLFVAEKEGYSLSIRLPRGRKTLQLNFSEGSFQEKRRKPYIAADDAREMILMALRSSTKPLTRGQILGETGLGTATWNVQINSLMENGRVTREGQRRSAAYTLVES